MSQQPFGDIPLFREIQKLLAAGKGPVNLEIARQIAGALVAQTGRERSIPPDATRAFSDAVRSAEVVLSGYTRVPLAEPMRARAVGLGWWVESTLAAWRWLLERLAERFTAEFGRLASEETPEAGQLQAALSQISPLIMGMQAGSLIGNLASDILGRYDLPIAREDDGDLFFVWPNIERVKHDYGFEHEAFIAWLCLRDAARHLIATGIPWVQRYYKSLMMEVIDSIEIDVSDLERRLMEMQTKGMDVLQEGMTSEEVLPVVHTERHKRALERLRSFLAVFEGYAGHAAAVVKKQTTDDTTKIDEGMARYRATPTQGEAMLSSILGVSIDRSIEASGRTFCAAVGSLRGLPTLNRVWDAPDNLPALEEVRDPFAWMERVIDE